MYKYLTASILALSFSTFCLAASATGTPSADAPREAPGKPHQPTSVNAPRQQ